MKAIIYILVIGLLFSASVFSGCVGFPVDKTQNITIRDKAYTDGYTVLTDDGSVYFLGSYKITPYYEWNNLKVNNTYQCILQPDGRGEYRWIKNCTELR